MLSTESNKVVSFTVWRPDCMVQVERTAVVEICNSFNWTPTALQRPGLVFQVSDLLFFEKELQRVNITCYQGARNACTTTGTISGISSELGGFCLSFVGQWPR
jgi:hypothetical protein